MARALVLLVVALLSFVIAVAANADPPDPTWIAGFWDDDDQDSAVDAILAIRGVVARADLNPPTFLLVEPRVPDPVAPAVTISLVANVESRAPPVAPKPLA